MTKTTVKTAKRNDPEKVGRANGRVIGMTKQNSILLKQHFLNLETIGCSKDHQEICNEIFAVGLHKAVSDLKPEDHFETLANILRP